jgi:ATP-dependent DNA helicase DinG
MATAVARAFEDGGVALTEAGTGTGKTLAYLIPAILSRKRVLISTGTKNLQDQIFFKDIPGPRGAGASFSATCMKGRSNYSSSSADQIAEGAGSAMQHVFVPILREWAGRTETGDRAELEDLPEDIPLWNEVAAAAETCLGSECPRYDECFVTRMRQRAAESDIVIVIHHLLCADAAVRQSAFGEVIPACHLAVVDEAHQLEDVATQYFGFSLSNYRVEDLARDVDRLVASGAVEHRSDRESLAKALERLRDDSRSFFTELAFAHRSSERGRSEERVRATTASLEATGEAAVYLTGALDLVESTLALLPRRAPGPGRWRSWRIRPRTSAPRPRAGEIRTELRFRSGRRIPPTSTSSSSAARGHSCAPADRRVRHRPRLLLDKMHATVLTSATLTVEGGFGYIRGRLGISTATESRLPSEFDFARQALLYLPPRMPDPRSPEFALAAGREVIEILKRTRGRAFVLFTSYATLRAVQAVAEMALDYPMLVQGTAPRTQLLRQFRETPHAVLFATASFWQGVDVVGEALSCVIIDKLPSASARRPDYGGSLTRFGPRGRAVR